MQRFLFLVLLASLSVPAYADDSLFSTHLYAKFQVKACTNCHDFFDKKRGGRAFNTHKGRTAEDCADCHDRGTTGFDDDEWFARTGLYTSKMTVKQTCEALKTAVQASFKSRALLAKQVEKHLFEDPRVLWAIDGATPQSGQLPEDQKQKDLVKGGLVEWKAQVLAWIKGGMKCE
jgi:hypothetical protein